MMGIVLKLELGGNNVIAKEARPDSYREKQSH